jgi:hypothetical protein
MAGFSTGMARIGDERGVRFGTVGSATLDQKLEEVVLGDLLALNGFPRVESRAGSIGHFQCIGSRPLLRVIVVRKVTCFLKFDKCISYLFQPRYCRIGPA